MRKVIGDWSGGELTSADETVYDGAVASCGTVARRCFGEDSEDDVDYDVSWVEEDDGSFTAEVRPS